jgi:DNA primase
VAYLVESGRIDTREAYRMRHGDEPANAKPTTSRTAPTLKQTDAVTPPNQQWQERAWEFVAWSQSQLWDDTGSKARAWLKARGLEAETIRRAGLGYNPRDLYEARTLGTT